MRRPEHGGIFFRLLGLVFFLAFLFVLYVFRHPLMRFAGELWVVNDPATKADVIVVLGDDNYFGDRAAHAAELYRSGLAPEVVASGRLLRPTVGIAELIEHDLEEHGVPAASILKFPHRAGNTREEALALRELIASRGWRRVLVVTSNYHARRARYILGRVFPPSVTVSVSAAADSQFDPSRWWETREGQKIFFTEVLGYVEAWWELRNGDSEASSLIFYPWIERYSSYRIGNIRGLQAWYPVL